jgi:hypothetical protein
MNPVTLILILLFVLSACKSVQHREFNANPSALVECKKSKDERCLKR